MRNYSGFRFTRYTPGRAAGCVLHLDAAIDERFSKLIRQVELLRVTSQGPGAQDTFDQRCRVNATFTTRGGAACQLRNRERGVGPTGESGGRENVDVRQI